LSCSTIHSISIHQDFRRTTLLQPSETTLSINSKRARSFLPNVQTSPTRTQLIPSSKQPNMQPLTIRALLASSALATYAPGSVCNSNLECNSNCIKSQWTIAASGNGSSYRFVCDPAASDDTQYYSSVCNKFTFTGNSYDKGATARACAKVGGLFVQAHAFPRGRKVVRTLSAPSGPMLVGALDW
jgi:hypothetical protein